MRNYLRAIFAATIVIAAITAVPGPASAHSSYDSLLAKVKRATAKYHSIDKALKDGYLPTDICVAIPGGGMGYHYVNPELFDHKIEAFHPEAILYIPTPGGRKLAGIEYVQTDADQDLNTADDRPTLFGVPFAGPMEGHEPGMPIHYDLHAWLFKHNPDGLFAEYNPRVTCP